MEEQQVVEEEEDVDLDVEEDELGCHTLRILLLFRAQEPPAM